jgi:uncharacterized phiE125 gp8 family phage protein
MFEQIVTPRATSVVTPEQVASFGRFDCPSNSPLDADYTMLQLMIEAATDQIEVMSATAMINETILLTLDFFPGTQDPRNLLDYQMGRAYEWMIWYWQGLWTKDSIELIRRPVVFSLSPLVAPVVTYNDINGVNQVFSASNYEVFANKITLNVGSFWPLTDRRQDCIQIEYTAGYGTDLSTVPAQLQLAVLYLAAHFWENRSIVTVEKTSEVYMTLCSLLQSFKSCRIPR